MTATIFLAALIAFGLVMVGMAVGVIVSNRRIAGSCGGLANMQDRFGEPMCECGAKPGESCGRDDSRTFEATPELLQTREEHTEDRETVSI